MGALRRAATRAALEVGTEAAGQLHVRGAVRRGLDLVAFELQEHLQRFPGIRIVLDDQAGGLRFLALGTAALLLVGPRIGDGGGDLPGGELVEALVALVQSAARVHA